MGFIQSKKIMKPYKSLLIVFIGALYFFFDSVLIVLPSGLITPLMDKYSITATGLSFLAAIYFYSYSLLQLPNGLLIDKFGAKKIAIVGLAICALSLFIFSISKTYIAACIARLLMGVGASAGYLVPMILAMQWLNKKHYVMAIGCIVFIECFGAIFGQNVVIYIYNLIGLEKTILLLSGLSIALLLLVFFIIPNNPGFNARIDQLNKTPQTIFLNLIKIFKTKYYWLIAICAALFWAPAALFASLWGINFIVTNNHVSNLIASHLLMYVWIGIGIGGPLIGLLVKYFDQKISLILLFAIIGFLVSISIIYFSYSVLLLAVFLFGLGITCSSQVLTFGLIHDHTPRNIVATAFGFNNMAICFSNALFQIAAGYLLDIFWQHTSSHGMRIYSLMGYKKMLLLMPACYLLIIFIILILAKNNILKTINMTRLLKRSHENNACGELVSLKQYRPSEKYS